jgi:hypothetical protein
MSDPVSDPILDALLASDGCPFKGGTVDSVIWMLGYKAGLERAKAEFDEVARTLDPHYPAFIEAASSPFRSTREAK